MKAKLKDMAKDFARLVFIQKLLHQLASRALMHAHPAKSNFKVGAAGIAVGKLPIPRIVSGWNNESRHGDSIHAEESMVAKLKEGEMLLRAVILGENKMSLAPCGNCREVLASRSAEDAEVLVQTGEGVNEWLRVRDLLPNTYDRKAHVSSLEEGDKDLALFKQALSIMNDRPYVPYISEFGAAAALTKNGAVIGATDKQDAAYHHDLASENLLVMADMLRDRRISTVLFLHDSESSVFPDGRSRQKLYESSQVSGVDFKVISASTSGQLWYSTVSKLLPYAFGPKDLGIDVSKY